MSDVGQHAVENARASQRIEKRGDDVAVLGEARSSGKRSNVSPSSAVLQCDSGRELRRAPRRIASRQ